MEIVEQIMGKTDNKGVSDFDIHCMGCAGMHLLDRKP